MAIRLKTAVLDEVGRGLGPSAEAKFFEDVAEVIFNRLIAETHRGGDLFIGFTFRHEGQNPALLR